jgi:hypothetical protein
LGVTFGAAQNGTPRVWFFINLPFPGDNIMRLVPGTQGGGDFSATFTNPTHGVGIQVGDLQAASLGETFFRVFDSSGNVIASYILQDFFTSTNLTFGFFGVVSPTPIARLEVTVGAFDFVIFDHLQFESDGIGLPYCGPSVPNSTGASGSMSATGSSIASSNDLTLTASNLPLNSVGLLLVAPVADFVPQVVGSQGAICLGGGIGRYVNLVQSSGSSGSINFPLNLAATPSPNGLISIVAGESWFFQTWHRDANPTVTSNFTNGLEVRFL